MVTFDRLTDNIPGTIYAAFGQARNWVAPPFPSHQGTGKMRLLRFRTIQNGLQCRNIFYLGRVVFEGTDVGIDIQGIGI